MNIATRPPRSFLFLPATRLERLDKALTSGADAVIIDLEDAVAPADKAAARLSDGKFKSNAPPQVVAKATEEAEALAARVAAIDAKIEEVKKLA